MIRSLFYALSVAGVVIFVACGGVQPPIGAPLTRGSIGGTFQNHHTFHYTGAAQSFVVPANTTLIKVVALGAAGGVLDPSYSDPARGGRVSALLPVRPGERLYVYVGGAANPCYSGGFNGGGDPGGNFGCGGGGASDVREGGDALRFRILVAAGGGGRGAGDDDIGVRGGAGGGRKGRPGGTIPSYPGAATGGGGGTQSRGGAGGKEGVGYGHGYPGFAGKLGAGGNGGDGGYGETGSLFGGDGGGGGGGYYGGGGGGGGSGGASGGYGFNPPGGGGGGGSSYVEPTAKVAHTLTGWKNATGNGLVVISW